MSSVLPTRSQFPISAESPLKTLKLTSKRIALYALQLGMDLTGAVFFLRLAALRDGDLHPALG